MLLKNRLQGFNYFSFFHVHSPDRSDVCWLAIRCRMRFISGYNLDKLKINHSTMRPSIFTLRLPFNRAQFCCMLSGCFNGYQTKHFYIF